MEAPVLNWCCTNLRTLFVLLVVFFDTPVQADILAYDGFDYEDNTRLVGTGESSGGFTGSWTGDNLFRSVETSLFDTTRALDVSGNRAVAQSFNGNRDIYRSFPPLADSTVYFSFLMKPEGQVGDGAFDGWFGWVLRSGPGLFIGKPSSHDNYVIETIGGGGQRNTGYPVEVDEATFFVLRADLLPGNDVLQLFVNPDFETGEPAQADAVKRDLDLGIVNRFSLSGPGAFSFDEIRIGDTFEDVAPFSFRACDLDQDGMCDVQDIDLLADEIRNGRLDLLYDLDRDGNLGASDLDIFVHDLLHTSFGDSNLDGQFGTKDLIDVFAINEYEDNIPSNSTWADGDWNGDGEFNSGDLVKACKDGGYDPSDVVLVPEPFGLIPLGLMTVALLTGRIRRTRGNLKTPTQSVFFSIQN